MSDPRPTVARYAEPSRTEIAGEDGTNSDRTGADRGESDPGHANSPGHPRPLRVLVADDDATNRLVIRAMIERFGHAVDAVANGMEAVAAVSATRYDVVLMDVMMPTMDGISATLAIRSLDGPASLVPILGLTGHNSRDQHAALRRSGMTRVITKPVTSKDLGAALSAAVNTGERGS